MSAPIVARKVRVFVPSDMAAADAPARTRAMTWSHFAAGMGTPVVEASRAVAGGHEIDLVEYGDAGVAARARTEKR